MSRIRNTGLKAYLCSIVYTIKVKTEKKFSRLRTSVSAVTVMMILDPVEPGPGCGPHGGRPHGGFLRSPLQGVLLAHRPLHRLGTH
jgi:hypothetical protein